MPPGTLWVWMAELLVGDPGVSAPWPAAIGVPPVEEVAVSETDPVGSVQPVPEHLTAASKAIGAPCTTGKICPPPSCSVVVEPRAAEAACQLFTRAFASKEPNPVARS